MVRRNSVMVDGTKIGWEEAGEGTPVVMIHGIPTSPALWRHVIPKVPDARCLAFEMVGYGHSIPEGRERDISVGAQADYLAAWLHHLGIEKAIFAGHDLGGGVAQIAAVRNPGLCAGLFLTNAIGYDSWPIPSVKAMRAMAPVTSHLPAGVGKQIVRTLMLRGHDDRLKASEAAEVHWAPYAEYDGTEALVRQMEALNVDDTLSVQNDLSRLQVPARIAWGTADQFQKLKYGERFARDLAAPLRRIQGGKHFTPEDHPDVIADEINKLLYMVH
jgi:pimeloyl-ACP methyl ester carboxylesterase